MESYTPSPVPLTGDVSLPQDAIDQLVVSTVRTALEPMADGIRANSTAVVAWISLDNVQKDTTQRFELVLKSSYYRVNSWTVTGPGAGAGDNTVTVPEPGLYRVSANLIIQRATGEGLFVEQTIRVADSGGGSVIVGYISGYRYDVAEAMPARCTSEIIVPILDPAEEMLVFYPASNNQTPVIESTPGENHQIIIQKIGEL